MLAAPGLARAEANCDAVLAYSTARQGVAVLVLRNGQPVCEGYVAPGAADASFEIWSGTKSFVGVMAAAAVQDGLLTLDEPVSLTLEEWRADPQQAKVTIRQLLTLTSGLHSVVGKVPEYAEAVARPLSTPPGEIFQYGPAPFQLFGEVMKRKLKAAGRPSDPLDYLRTRILDPIGLMPGNWRRPPGGDPLMPQGAVLSVREWVKFGEFVRLGGVAGGKALVDPAALAELFKGTSANPGYGVTWWLPSPAPGPQVATARLDLNPDEGIPRDVAVAAGAGYQRLYVIPSLGLTISRETNIDPLAPTPPQTEAPPWSDAAFLKLVMALP